GRLELRLGRPRDGWPNPHAVAAASGAGAVLHRVRVFDSTADAVADLRRVYATTGRVRDLATAVVDPDEAAAQMLADARAAAARGDDPHASARAGILFGPERTGLTNDDVALADAALFVDLNPSFRSLNLAQAVLLIGYHWWRAARAYAAPADPVDDASGAAPAPAAGDDAPDAEDATDDGDGQLAMRPYWGRGRRGVRATHAEVQGFFDHLERALDDAGFFRVAALRPTMVRNLRTLFQRAGLTEQEVRTLHGVVTALCGRRRDQL
ncbi:MAG: TrmH family RNA methyltransferase, partial [Acidobacteriota bacterium]